MAGDNSTFTVGIPAAEDAIRIRAGCNPELCRDAITSFIKI